jgi:NitT/TauT family transport system substrate-binding protein
MQMIHSRRHFLASASLTVATAALGPRASLADEGPPEVTTIRLRRSPSICTAPTYIAEDLLHAEGFTDVRYVVVPPGLPYTLAIARGEIDIGADLTAVGAIFRMDGGVPMTVLAGLHAGCYELFVHESIRTISDLKGKKVSINILGSPKHLHLAILAAHVGLDPQKDIQWVEGNALGPAASFPMELFIQGKVDAFLGFPPEPQELRSRKIGRVILNMTTDAPWSQYFCCMVAGNREFIHANPIATKRVLRALLKADEICAGEPAWAAQRLVDGGFTERYDYALQTLTEISYANWREYDPEDSLRFYALRLYEVGMIESSPNTLIAEGTDWHLLNELKRELKA